MVLSRRYRAEIAQRQQRAKAREKDAKRRKAVKLAQHAEKVEGLRDRVRELFAEVGALEDTTADQLGWMR